MSTEPSSSAHEDARARGARAFRFVRQVLHFPSRLRNVTNRLAGRAETPDARRRRRYQVWAVVLVAAGLLLLAYNEGWLPAWLARATAFWPAALVVGGLALLFTGQLPLDFRPPAFAVERGGVVEGELWIDAGAADVRVEALADADHLAAGEFPNFAGPRVEVQGTRARLLLDRRTAGPLLPGEWRLALNAQLPWAVHLRSSTGAASLNLRDLPVTALDLKAWAGPVDLTLPAAGQGELNLRLALGDLTLRLPEGVGLNLRVKAAPLVNVNAAGSALTQTAPGEWTTAGFSDSPHRFLLNVDMTAGDLRIS